MNYQECRAYIDDSAKYGSVLGLDNMREMLDRLGNPQDAVPYSSGRMARFAMRASC